jgi:hypothetical protein
VRIEAHSPVEITLLNRFFSVPECRDNLIHCLLITLDTEMMREIDALTTESCRENNTGVHIKIV